MRVSRPGRHYCRRGYSALQQVIKSTSPQLLEFTTALGKLRFLCSARRSYYRFPPYFATVGFFLCDSRKIRSIVNRSILNDYPGSIVLLGSKSQSHAVTLKINRTGCPQTCADGSGRWLIGPVIVFLCGGGIVLGMTEILTTVVTSTVVTGLLLAVLKTWMTEKIKNY